MKEVQHLFEIPKFSYAEFYASLPLKVRIQWRIAWWIASVCCAVVGRPTPGEKVLARMLKREQERESGPHE